MTRARTTDKTCVREYNTQRKACQKLTELIRAACTAEQYFSAIRDTFKSIRFVPSSHNFVSRESQLKNKFRQVKNPVWGHLVGKKSNIPIVKMSFYLKLFWKIKPPEFFPSQNNCQSTFSIYSIKLSAVIQSCSGYNLTE